MKSTVLIVDDDPITRKRLSARLESEGFRTLLAANGREALSVLEDQTPTLILIDLQMPVMDGLSATRAIRAHERAGGLSATPVIMLTANALPEHLDASRAAGADRHLTKPVGAAALLGAIAEAAEAAERRKAA
jgi:CheY-like chemotaxis protein